MSFWSTSDNQKIEQTGEFVLGQDLEPIPDNTQLKVIIDEAKWDEYEMTRYISLRWVVIDGEYKGRKIYQKVKVCDQESKRRDKAIRMLAAIDANAGGTLMKSGQEPDDMALSINLMNKPMLIMSKVWKLIDENTGEEKSGNWVSAVAPLNKTAAKPAAPKEPDFDDDIAF